ncbi:armadillo-type protein [Cladochytrium replicatum]|nr:armadillo-type protein [Cladochytrium replicatum]
MDASLSSQLVAALNTIYNPTASNADRSKAQQICTEVQESPNAFYWGFQIAHQSAGFSDEFRHFGLSLMEQSIRFRFTELLGSLSDVIRSVVELLQAGTKDINLEPNYIKEKVAAVVVGVAKCTWPTTWPDFDQIMRNIYTIDPTREELVLIVYRTIAEDIFEYEDAVADIRKRNLITSLTFAAVNTAILSERSSGTGQGTIGGMATSVTPPPKIPRTDPELLASLIASEPNNEGWISRWALKVEQWNDLRQSRKLVGAITDAALAERMVVSTLNTIAAYVDWILARSLTSARIPWILTKSVTSDDNSIRMAALGGLLTLVQRNILLEDERNELIWRMFFYEGGVENLYLAWANAHGSSDLSSIDTIEQMSPITRDGYPYAKLLASVFVTLGERHVVVKNADKVPPNFARFLEFMLVVSHHPSPVICSTSVNFWVELLKDDTLGKLPDVVSLFPRLLLLVTTRCIKASTVMSSAAGQYYCELEYDNKSEFETAHNSLRQRCLKVLELISDLKCLETFNWMASRIVASFNDPRTLLKPATTIDEIFSVNGYILETFMVWYQKKSKGEGSGVEEIVRPNILALVDKIVDFVHEDPSVVREQLSMIVCCASILPYNVEILTRTMRKLFAFVSYRIDLEKSQLDEDAKAVRNKAAGSLIKLALEMPDILMTVFNDVAQLVQEMQVNPNQMWGVKNQLQDLLTAIIVFSSIDDQQKRIRFDAVTEPLIREWEEKVPFLCQMNTMMDIMSANLLSSNGEALQLTTHADGDLGVQLQQRSQARSNLSLTHKTKLLNEGFVSVLWAPYLNRIVPLLLACISGLHSLWEPQVWENYPSEFRSILEITVNERVAMLGGTPVAEKESRETGSEFEKQIRQLRSWLPQIRESLIVQKLIQSCPVSSIQAVLDPILPPFLAFLCEKLTFEWKKLMDSGIDADFEMENDGGDVTDAAMEDVSDEILNQRILRSLTTAFDQLLSSIFLFSHVLDAYSLPLCSKALHDGYHKDIHSEVVNFINDLYVTMRSVSIVPKHTLSSLPGMSEQSLQNYETKLGETSSVKEQQILTRSLLANVTGATVSEWGRKMTPFSVSLEAERAELRNRRKLQYIQEGTNAGKDVLGDLLESNAESSGIEKLFTE